MEEIQHFVSHLCKEEYQGHVWNLELKIAARMVLFEAGQSEREAEGAWL